MKKKILVTRMIPGPALDMLAEHFDITVHRQDRAMSKSELSEAIQGKDALLSLLSDTIDSELMDVAGPQLKVIANYAVGFNNIDLDAATSRGIAVTNTPGVLTNATADLAWALLFSCSRRILEADRFLREGNFKGWSPTMYLGQDITGATLGIIGAGRIGSNFGRKAKAFDMKILYYSNMPNSMFEAETGARYVPLETLLKESDYVSVHVPLSEATTHLIGEDELKRMKRTAILINTARGPIVDEKALVYALKEGWIGGAGLDVYENEPEVEPELLTMNQVVLVPHIASATTETRGQMGRIAARNIIQTLQGIRPENIVNQEVVLKK